MLYYINSTKQQEGGVQMEHQMPVCTCQDVKCPNHPNHHNRGCNPCIAKNLDCGEIPACFFRLVDGDLSQLSQFKIEDFVQFYSKHKSL